MFEKFEVQTKLSKDEIQRRIRTFVEFGDDTHYGSLSEDGFVVAQKFYSNSGVVIARNSFAPVAQGRIVESNGITTVSVTLRMHLSVLALFMPLYLLCMLLVAPFPLMFALGYIGFLRPAKKLRAELEELMMERSGDRL